MRPGPLEGLGTAQKAVKRGLPVEIAEEARYLEETGWDHFYYNGYFRWEKGDLLITYPDDSRGYRCWEVYQDSDRHTALAGGKDLASTIVLAAKEAMKIRDRWQGITDSLLSGVPAPSKEET